MTVEIRCPSGSRREGNVCVYYVQPVPLPRVITRCPSNTRLENDACIYEPRPVPVIVRCPPNSRYENGVCYVEPSSIPTPNVVINCVSPSRLEGNRCVVDVGSVSVPSVIIRCPPDSYLQNGACVYQVPKPSQPTNIVIRCPPNSYMEGSDCIMNIPKPILPNVIVRCPAGADLEDNICVFNIVGTAPRLTERITGSDCEGSSGGVLIHNNNTVHAPVNITSNNVNSISVNAGDCSEGQNEYTVVRNGVTEKVPCQSQSSSCCNVLTPRVCTNTRGNWECGHRQYRRCGDFCKEDVVMLKPIRSTYRRNMLVMPPPGAEVNIPRRRGGRVNCYGCLNGGYNCSPECYVSIIFIALIK